MDKNQDVGDSGFEDRIRDLFQDGAASRGVSAASVIRGARRRRVRHRATMAGSSLAVLGVAAGAVAFGGHSTAPSRTSGVVAPPAVTNTATPGTTSAPTTTAAPSTSMPAPGTCSGAVTGTVPTLTHTTADGLDFETVSGTTAGIPWSVQIHAFPDWQSWLDWRKTQADPPDPASKSPLEGPPALFRQSGSSQYYTESADPYHSFGVAGSVIGGGVAGSPKVYLDVGWVQSAVDHMCLQFARHAEFEPVYRIQGRGFMVLGYTAADEPRELIGYNTGGYVVGTMDDKSGLVGPKGF